MSTAPNYTVISADTHAGGSHEQYREFLDPAWRDEFDAWREQYRNPWKDLKNTDLRVRNWDDARRDADMLADGTVAEVLFPNTVPPFYPAFVLFAGPPKDHDYERRRAGLQAHNRWMADFVGRRPERRAGIGQVLLNDIDHAIEDATWIKEHGLRGGVLIPTIPPDVKWVRPLYDTEYDRLWAVLQDLEIPVHVHGGTGAPDYGPHAAAMVLMVAEVPFYGVRNLVHMMAGGVFERFPRLKFVLTESSLANCQSTLRHLDGVIASVRKGSVGELKYAEGSSLPKSATEYFQQSGWVGISFPGRRDIEARDFLPPDRVMWGSDYPHDEGTGPFSREALRQVMHDLDEATKRAILGENAAKLYGFDLDALAPLAAQYGPSVEELAQPLTELPDNANSALRRNAGEQLLV